MKSCVVLGDRQAIAESPEDRDQDGPLIGFSMFERNVSIHL
ncbi:MAG: hypothetical protein JWO91_1770, partial [Acidobacteriaceae bacterium]|nr:hypothetical protein [Acidobacteriaceae bacterium]